MGRPRERRPLFGGVYVLVPIWLGAPRPAWPPKSLMKRGLPGFLGRYLVTVNIGWRTGGGEEHDRNAMHYLESTWKAPRVYSLISIFLT